jgi:acyl-CoA synthetase (AMP-forming)/AMP-acid ligase II
MDESGIDPRMARQSGGLTIGGLFRQSVAAHPRSIALADRHKELTYAELNERVNRLVNALATRGIGAGDRVAILSENRREYVELELAVAHLGAILACQNWRQADAELTHCVGLVSPKLIFVSERYRDTLFRIGSCAPAIVLDEDYERLLATSDTRDPPDIADAEDGVIILYTSGTTGMPKGALISHRAMIARSMIARIDFGMDTRRAFLAWAPLFHMVSTDSVYATLMGGGKVIVMDGLDVPELVTWTTREEIGHLTLMPGMIDRVIEELHRTGARPKGMISLGCMADLVPRHQIAEITTLLNAPFRNSFGSTETGSPPASKGVVPIGIVADKLSKTPNTFCRLRLVDINDNDVQDGEPGELAFRGPSLFSGYWKAPQANAKDFRGGWFHMGDVFVRNADGTLDFVDRRKYLIKSGGENIYPAEIENALRASPRIAEAVIVRKSDPRWGEVPVAFIVRLDETLTHEDVIATCRGKIANYKLPKDVIFVADADLPRSATGKIKRHELEDRLKSELTTSTTAA